MDPHGMDPGLLRKRLSSLGGQREAIERLTDGALRDAITPAGALAFGVVPAGESDGTLVLGAAGRVHAGCGAALSAALGREVELVRFEEGLVKEAIGRFYLSDGDGDDVGIDLATFESPEFLEDRPSARLLLTQKDGTLPECEVRPPRGRVAFLELRMHSVLRSLDRRRGVEFARASAELPFRLVSPERRGRRAEPEAILFRDEMPGRDCRAFLSLSVFYDGDEHLHAVTGRDIEKLPHVLHPSELQLAEIAGREARFWVYDRIETVKAAPAEGGPLASFARRYYFLHYGTRFERELRLDVLAFALVRRSRIRLAGRDDRARPEDLVRLLGLDFETETGPPR